MLIILGLFFSTTYWHSPWRSAETEKDWAMDQLTTPDNSALQNRINNQLFGSAIVDAPGIGTDIDSTVNESAMDAKLAGLTKNVTTQKLPSSQQLNDFYQSNRDSYREPSKLWLWVVGFTTARHGGQVFEKAQLALNHSEEKSSTPEGDMFDRYGAILSTELEEKYGRAFTAKLLSLISDNDSESLPCWAGPISSPFGAHLVCVKKINWGAYTPLEEIRSELINDWRFSVATES